jgi:hypothetical protein
MLALVVLGTVPGAPSPATLAAAPRAVVAAVPVPVRSTEIRALWVLRGSLTRPDRIDRLVADAARSGFNTLLLQIRGRGDAYYDSAIEPRGVAIAPTFDPLAYAITAANKAGLRVHVWFNTNLIASTASMPTSRTHIVNAHPEWLMVPRPIAADLARLGPRDPRYVPRLVEWTKRNAAGRRALRVAGDAGGGAVRRAAHHRHRHALSRLRGSPRLHPLSVQPVRSQPGVAARLP